MTSFDGRINFQKCEDLDPDGYMTYGEHSMLCFRGLSFEAQDMLYESVFAKGVEGECGGLMTQEERMKWKEQGRSGKYTVESCFGNKWHVEGEQKLPLSDMGFHGRHHIALKDSAECQAMLMSIQELVSSCSAVKSPHFEPEYVAVTYENLGGRVIKGTLCGIAYDDDRVSRRGEVGDGTPKVFLFLGRAAVTLGFKEDKSDKQWLLRVRMAPGDCLLRFGNARAWCMGVLKIDNTAPEGRGDKNPCPFDFVHVKICDHRRLRKENPDLFQRCHAKRIDPKYDKFNMNPGCFQYAYSILGPDVPGGPIMCHVVNDNSIRFAAVASNGTLGHGVTLAQACYVDPSRGKGQVRAKGKDDIASSKGKSKDKGYASEHSAPQDDAPCSRARRWKCKQRRGDVPVCDALIEA